jgi:hypothetical protein
MGQQIARHCSLRNRRTYDRSDMTCDYQNFHYRADRVDFKFAGVVGHVAIMSRPARPFGDRFATVSRPRDADLREATHGSWNRGVTVRLLYR